ncbi:MAG: CehA/McbA family metallohydrolase [Clostridia bacterium]|nr:CehA/McbA family metallohydrolase [Clostridia bacterium]
MKRKIQKKVFFILAVLSLIIIFLASKNAPESFAYVSDAVLAPVKERNYNFYFGCFHSHTSYSDGTGTPSQAFSHARDIAKGDFLAVTDHGPHLNIWEWLNTRIAADYYNKDGVFVALAGYEITPKGTVGSWGHMNVMNTKSYIPEGYTDLGKVYERLDKMIGAIAQFNHPGWTNSNVFDDFGRYSKEMDDIIELIEVGNGYGPLDESRDYKRYYEYYTKALDKGWHVAPANNQDNHKADWISAMETRTVVLAPSLTRESIFDAIRNKRVYATEDKNLKITYKINDCIMGATLSQPPTLNFDIIIEDPDPEDRISKVDIISERGLVVDSRKFESNKVDWKFTHPLRYNYYFVKVTLGSGKTALTAPIWTR